MASALQERNRALMHARNPYRERPPDFALLARLYPDFARHIGSRSSDGTVQLNWADPQVNPGRECLRATLATSATLSRACAGDRRPLSHAAAARL